MARSHFALYCLMVEQHNARTQAETDLALTEIAHVLQMDEAAQTTFRARFTEWSQKFPDYLQPSCASFIRAEAMRGQTAEQIFETMNQS